MIVEFRKLPIRLQRAAMFAALILLALAGYFCGYTARSAQAQGPATYVLVSPIPPALAERLESLPQPFETTTVEVLVEDGLEDECMHAFDVEGNDLGNLLVKEFPKNVGAAVAWPDAEQPPCIHKLFLPVVMREAQSQIPATPTVKVTTTPTSTGTPKPTVTMEPTGTITATATPTATPTPAKN